MIQQSSTAGCVNRNGRLCIGLCIIVILYYMFSNSSHLLSFTLISIFDLLILIVTLFRYLFQHNYGRMLDGSVDKADVLNYIKTKPLVVLQFKNNSDNNFQIHQYFQRTDLCNVHRLPQIFQKFTSNKQSGLRSKSSTSNITILLKLLCLKTDIDYHTLCNSCLCDILYHPIFESSYSIAKGQCPL